MIAGQDSVKRGPELLAALRDAGVVDAGGYGLTIMFAGVVAALRGDEPPELDHHAPARISHPEHNSSTYRFCTNFAVTGRDLSPGHYIEPLEELGDSVLVVGDSRTLKVHLHTDDPELATEVFAEVGEVSRLDVADMRLQVQERDARLARRRRRSRQRRTARAARQRSRRVAALTNGASARGPARGAAGALRRAGGRQRRGAGGDVPRARRADARRRPDAEPVDLRPARGDPRGARRGGRRAAQQRERDHGRRTRRAALRQGGLGGAHDQPAGRSRRRRGAGARPLRRGERAGAARGAHARAHRRRGARRARRRAGPLQPRRRRRLRPGRGARLGRSRRDAALDPAGARRRRWRAASPS